MEKIERVALVAGSGMMPLQIIKNCREKGVGVFVAGLISFAREEDLADVPHVMARIGEVGKILGFFREHGAMDIVMSGGIKRPSLKELIPDGEGIKMLTKIALKKQGDDGLFRAVIGQLEERGFRVRGIEEVVPEMMFYEGVYGKVKPSKDDMADIHRGIEVAKALGAVDVGQAVVVQEGMVLAVEAAEGTDAMLERAAAVRKPGKAPVMVKIKKPGQDTRTDMPAIGIRTIEKLQQCGIGGIAVESGGILVIERRETIECADRAGLFIIGMTVES
jgi:DUF1009 family protein